MDTLPEDQHAREIELKLELVSGDAEALIKHPLLARARPVPEQSGQLHAVYYDTADHALRGAGLTLRVRRKNGHHIQTIKAEGGARGLALDRTEWESSVEGGIDLKAAASTPLASILADEAARERIKPAFTIETKRQAFLMERDGAVIELALDRARASAGSESMSFSELELELKQGEASALFSLARDLAEAVPLRLSPITKSERGYALIDGVADQPVTAGDIDLPHHASCAQAFQVIARSCLSQAIRNEALFRRTQDAEALHQMRVGFRRLNAAISLFKPMLTGRESKSVRADLRWAGKQLGPARDLDVLIGNLHNPADVGSYAAELRKAERQRVKAYDKLLKILSSPRFMRVILQTAAWIEAGRWLRRDKRGARAARQRSVTDHAVEELTRRWKPIRKRVKRISRLEPDERHALRIRIKRLRYSSEFLEGLFKEERAKKPRRPWLASLKRLQDILGEMNDISVGSSLVPSLAKSDPERAKQQEKKLLSQAEAAAGNLRKSNPFWI
jgi:inorganic triphosphatase YgiF